MKELARAEESKGGDLKSAFKRETPIQRSPYAAALDSAGISRQTAQRYPAI